MSRPLRYRLRSLVGEAGYRLMRPANARPMRRFGQELYEWSAYYGPFPWAVVGPCAALGVALGLALIATWPW